MKSTRNRVLFCALFWLCLPEIIQSFALATPAAVDGYLQALGRKCARTYFPLQGFEVCKASVTFKIDCKGNISSIAVADHPRDVHTGEATDVADRALVDAIQNLGRLPIPPSEIGCPAAVSVTFDGRAEGPMKITAAFNGQGASNDK